MGCGAGKLAAADEPPEPASASVPEPAVAPNQLMGSPAAVMSFSSPTAPIPEPAPRPMLITELEDASSPPAASPEPAVAAVPPLRPMPQPLAPLSMAATGSRGSLPPLAPLVLPKGAASVAAPLPKLLAVAASGGPPAVARSPLKAIGTPATNQPRAALPSLGNSLGKKLPLPMPTPSVDSSGEHVSMLLPPKGASLAGGAKNGGLTSVRVSAPPAAVTPATSALPATTPVTPAPAAKRWPPLTDPPSAPVTQELPSPQPKPAKGTRRLSWAAASPAVLVYEKEPLVSPAVDYKSNLTQLQALRREREWQAKPPLNFKSLVAELDMASGGEALACLGVQCQVPMAATTYSAPALKCGGQTWGEIMAAKESATAAAA